MSYSIIVSYNFQDQFNSYKHAYMAVTLWQTKSMNKLHQETNNANRKSQKQWIITIDLQSKSEKYKEAA